MCACKMNEYLSTTLNKLKSNNYTGLKIVVGNESCDLDSAVCSLVYAVFLDWLNKKSKTPLNNDENHDIFISMLDVDRDDFPLKTEITLCLREHGILESNLIFRDDIDLNELVISNPTNVILVDHHILSKRLEFLTPYVTEIVDHRPLDTNQWKYKDDIKNLITIVGSCSTLIAQKIRDRIHMLGNNEFFDSYPVCADLLYNVILLDTVNFSKEVNKATPLDEEMVAYLEDTLKVDDHLQGRQLKLESLLRERSDVTALSASQLLRKDVKILGEVFVPSFPILVKEFLEKPDALEAVTEALELKKCNLAVLLGMDLNAGVQRDVAIISPTCPKRGENLAKFLQEWGNPSLQLVPESGACVYFKQMNLAASRKQYMPALNEFVMKYAE